MSTTIYVLSLFLQLGLSFIMYVTADEYAEDKYEHQLSDRISNLTEAMYRNTTLRDGTAFEQRTLDMCNDEKASIRGFMIVYYMVVFLWYARQLQEVSKACW